jgi:hypothetical protein
VTGSAVPPPPASGYGVPAAPTFSTPPARPGMALAAMVLGIVGIVLCFLFVPSVLAVVFGLSASKKIKQAAGTLTGGGMAKAGWILGIVGIVVGAAFWVAAGLGVFDSDDKSIDALEVGDCVNVADIAEGAEIATVPSVPCDELHDGEVFFIDQLNPDRDVAYPGADEVDVEIAFSCVDEFESYVGAPLDLDELTVDVAGTQLTLFYIYPLEETWDLGRGEYTCIATTATGGPTLTGSVRGIGG